MQTSQNPKIGTCPGLGEPYGFCVTDLNAHVRNLWMCVAETLTADVIRHCPVAAFCAWILVCDKGGMRAEGENCVAGLRRLREVVAPFSD